MKVLSNDQERAFAELVSVMEATPPRCLADRVMDKTVDHLEMLACRWRDEKSYEDFNEYIASMKSVVGKIGGVEFIGMKKRPFGFQWRGLKDGVVRTTKIRGRNIVTMRD